MKRTFAKVLIAIRGLMAGACQNPDSFTLSENQVAQIKAEIRQAAIDHLNAKDAAAALVTAKFRYSFTDTNNEKTDLQGMWTALYARSNGSWKIRVRHESFAPLEN